MYFFIVRDFSCGSVARVGIDPLRFLAVYHKGDKTRVFEFLVNVLLYHSISVVSIDAVDCVVYTKWSIIFARDVKRFLLDSTHRQRT